MKTAASVFSNRPLLSVLALFSAVTFSPSNANAADGTQSIGNCKVIDKPGSYTLSKTIVAGEKDLTPSQSGNSVCILITADFVTLDLAGYTIMGPGFGPTAGTTGVLVEVGRRGATVRDGVITNFANGIVVSGPSSTIETIRAINNGFAGIFLQDGTGINGHRVIGNTSSGQNFGIYVYCPSVVLSNVASDNLNTEGVCTRLENSPAP